MMPRRATRNLFLVGILFFCVTALGFRPVDVTQENVALSGYDTVAYFMEGKAVKGSPLYKVESLGAVWRFSSKSNMRLFEKNPEKYIPAFGGYCSYTMGEGKAVSCDPKAFIIKDGRLYVMKDKEALEIWSQDPDDYLTKARTNWKQMSEQAKQ